MPKGVGGVERDGGEREEERERMGQRKYIKIFSVYKIKQKGKEEEKQQK